MRVLIGCECSGRVRDAFIALGHDAWSCDLRPTETLGPHITGDLLDVLGDGWDLGIFHPTCTYLTNSAEWAYGPGPYHQKVKPGTLVGEARKQARREAVAFVETLWKAPIPSVCIENPVGALSRLFLPPSQYIQPYDFGDDASKKTCLWLRGLPILKPTKRFPGRWVTDPRTGKSVERWGNQTDSGQNRLSPSDSRWAERSVTYQGIANAFASQWGGAMAAH